MKGIILAGGSGTRLHPMTLATCKQLMPIWDKPLIYYPLSVLMLAGIRDILLISTPQDRPTFQNLFGDGSALGIKMSYAIQAKPNGLAEAFIIGHDFVGKDRVALVLGDNIFYGHGLPDSLAQGTKRKSGATVFATQVQSPERYGVVSFDRAGKPAALEEKPKDPKSNYAVTGLYFYDNSVLSIAQKLKPSARGELEITDVNRAYLRSGSLHVEKLGRGIAWLDTGTPESLLQASNFIQIIEERQGLKIACLEEIAFNMGYINRQQLKEHVIRYSKSPYGSYLKRVLEENI